MHCWWQESPQWANYQPLSYCKMHKDPAQWPDDAQRLHLLTLGAEVGFLPSVPAKLPEQCHEVVSQNPRLQETSRITWPKFSRQSKT